MTFEKRLGEFWPIDCIIPKNKEYEMIKVRERRSKKQGFDSLVIEIPADFAVAHGLPERAFASLTVEKGKLVSEVIPYTAADEAEVDGFIGAFPGFDEEMKRIGD